jgi:tRNA 2-thiouridine synthesizing protein A
MTDGTFETLCDGFRPSESIAAFVDATGLRCPLPILRTKRALATLLVGERVMVKATDPDSVGDFRAFAALKGYGLREDRIANFFVFFLEKLG